MKGPKLYAHGDKQNGKLIPGVKCVRPGPLGKGTMAGSANSSVPRAVKPGVMKGKKGY